MDCVIFRHRVIGRQNRAAGISENLFDFQAFQTFPDDFRSSFDQKISPASNTAQNIPVRNSVKRRWGGLDTHTMLREAGQSNL